MESLNYEESNSPGDRYPLLLPFENNSADNNNNNNNNNNSNKTPRRVLAVVPYSFTFRAPVKGRWLGQPLLNIFTKEFAYIPPLIMGEEESPRASLDPNITIPAYIEELRTGLLRLHGREAECLEAGRLYEAEFRSLISKEFNNNDKINDIKETDTKSEIEFLLSRLPQRLLLKQRDVILHQVLRREAPMIYDEPIHILRYDHTPQGNPPKRLLVVHKPQGIPVHPSGRCRKNSVTSILEDIFGGVDAHRYHAVPLNNNNKEKEDSHITNNVECIAICHKLHGFELVRVWIGKGYVSREAWDELHAMLLLKKENATATTIIKTSKNAISNNEIKGLKVFVVHRLDAATSGVLLFGLDSSSARMTAEILSQKNDINNSIEEEEEKKEEENLINTVGCTKQYLARVHGKFDVKYLASVQHHCTCLNSSSFLNIKDNSFWLRVDRPIGCLSYHESLYGSPNNAITESWMNEDRKKHQQEEKLKTDVENSDNLRESKSFKEIHTAGRKRALHRDAAALEAKHERMRKLTIGSRTSLASTVNEAAKEEEKQETKVSTIIENNLNEKEISNSTIIDERIRRLYDSMKRAITLIRCIAYDDTCNESIVECLLLTGRTHQVRVHLASLGHPICGDSKYIRQSAKTTELMTTTIPVEDNGDSSIIKKNNENNKEENDHEGDGEDFDKSLSPQGIFLHAWRYTLRYSSNGSPEVLEAPPPLWATLNKTNQQK